MKDQDEVPAEAFLRNAMDYRSAAATLLAANSPATDPLYFLLAHAMELSLKAYLRAHGCFAPRGQRGHAITKLLGQCAEFGLEIDRDLRNVAQLLDSEGRFHGFRYFAFRSTTRPGIHLLRDVLGKFLVAVELSVAANPARVTRGAVMKLTMGMAEEKG